MQVWLGCPNCDLTQPSPSQGEGFLELFEVQKSIHASEL